MAYIVPTPESFKARFPAFADVDDSYILLLLSDAIDRFGKGWHERDRALVQVLWVAHILASEGYGTGGGGGAGGSATTGPVKRRKVGDVEVEFAGIATSGSSGGAMSDYLGTTMYGKQLLLLMRLNFPAIAAV